ncbi:unnamed protein product [Dibothriocephalus latus]|uniref:CEP76/DRC7 peptidase-like domain-containing protein n=1 Tax=Dibothriocephalus latus TaxID=60516 RepID=A0A3P7LL25_DIBLA|nr:unnamed protein product [Dibothriocephalus latus]
MLSYTRPRLLPYDETSITELPEEPPAFISVYLALQPAVKPFQALSDQVFSMESAELVARVKSWEREVAKQNKEGRFDFEALVMDSSCRSVLACRFLVPQNPPPDFLPSSYTAVQVEEVKLRLARYVSLIPFFSDSVAFHGLTDVWCSSEQFLKMLCGDYEEHAVLLANYFLFLDAKLAEAAGDVEVKMDETIPNVILCVGKAVPDDTKLNCLSFQIWANVQEKEEPWEVNWDLTNHKCWLPFDAVAGESSAGRRHHKRSSSIFTVQPSKLSYSTPNEREILALKFELEGALKDSFIEWRRGEVSCSMKFVVH